MKIYIDRDAMLKAIAVERKKSHSDRKTLDWCREMIKSQARHQELLQFFHAKGFFVCLVNNIPEGWLVRVEEYASLGDRKFSWVEPDYDVLRSKIELDLKGIPLRR
jgi:hypothetical protein